MRELLFAGVLVLFASLLSCSPVSGDAGLYPVRIDGRYGYIDANERLIIPAKFQEAEVFSEGLAAVKQEGKYGYIDASGTMVIAPEFAMGNEFSEGMALIWDG